MENYMRVCAHISKDAIKHNISEIKKAVKDSTKIMAVIKADGYGHGAENMAKVLLPYTDYFAVATIEEAVSLRDAGFEKPILLLGYTSPELFCDALKNKITVTVFTLENAKELSETAKKLGITAKIHLALDTGMERIGFSPNEESVQIIKEISLLENIEIEGMFTHFATSDEKDKSFTKKQTECFENFRKMLLSEGIKPQICHVSNSGAIMQHNYAFYDMVRAGIILYGLYPSDDVSKDIIDLQPVMELTTHIAHIKEVKKGETISYGRTFTAQKDMCIATIPVGYADGYPRLLSNKGKVLINGKYAPVTGRVCMDQFMVDVTDIPDAKVGDIVTLIGKQGDLFISADEIAKHAQTINYEIVCGISKRVPRIMR